MHCTSKSCSVSGEACNDVQALCDMRAAVQLMGTIPLIHVQTLCDYWALYPTFNAYSVHQCTNVHDGVIIMHCGCSADM